MSHAVGKVLQLVARLLARDGFRGLAGLLGCRGHGLYRGDRAAGLLRLDGQHLPVFGFALVGLAERAAQNGGRSASPLLISA